MKYFLLQLAQTISADEVGIPRLDGDQVVQNTLNLIYFAAGVTAVIVIILAGISFATSGGDAGKVKSARNKILFAVIGLVIVLAAFAITNFVIGRF